MKNWEEDYMYWWNPYENVTPVGSYYNLDYPQTESLFKSEPKFISSFREPKFCRNEKNPIGFK